jgi:glucose-6-phosphate 1-epimerase
MSENIRTITHTSSGASIKIHPYGATVLSYSSATHEFLFVSELAVLDGTRAIRGGIPVVFPIFGPSSDPKSSMPQHGFARSNTWTEVKDYDTAESAGILFQLELKDVITGRGERNLWAKSGCPYDCTLLLTVDFNGARLTTTLTVTNTGDKAFPFQALLHTYFKVVGSSSLKADQCFVEGLEGYTVTDKVTLATPYQVAENVAISVTGEVDRVYTPPKRKDVVNVTVGTGNDTTVSMKATAQINGAGVPVSCVVWNPFSAKAAGMADFGNDEYHDMLCVEPGILGDDKVLQPGNEAWLQQVVSI